MGSTTSAVPPLAGSRGCYLYSQMPGAASAACTRGAAAHQRWCAPAKPNKAARRRHQSSVRVQLHGSSDQNPGDRGQQPASSTNGKPNRHTNLILIGGRGCGKSALCRRIIAAEPRFSLYSLDDIIVESAGMSIPRMVENFGWAHFREVEFEVCKRVAQLCDRGWCLIDAGGGVVVDLDEQGDETYSQRKVDTLKRNGLGKIVYLRRDVEYLVTRTSGDRNRPSLSQVRSFEQVMCARSPWYERAADYVVDATGGSIEKEVKNKQEIKREVLRYFYKVTGEDPTDEQYKP